MSTWLLLNAVFHVFTVLGLWWCVCLSCVSLWGPHVFLCN